MAVSGKTAAPYEIPYFLGTDSPPDMAAVTKALAEKVAGEKWLSQSLKPTVGVKQASSNLTLSTSYQDVPGAKLEITPVVASLLKLTVIFNVEVVSKSPGGGSFAGTVNFDGTDQTVAAAAAVFNTGQVESSEHNLGITCSQVYLLTLTAAAHTIKMRGKMASGSGTLFSGNSSFLYELVAS